MSPPHDPVEKSRENWADDVRMHISETAVDAVVVERELLMVDPE